MSTVNTVIDRYFPAQDSPDWTFLAPIRLRPVCATGKRFSSENDHAEFTVGFSVLPESERIRMHLGARFVSAKVGSSVTNCTTLYGYETMDAAVRDMRRLCHDRCGFDVEPVELVAALAAKVQPSVLVRELGVDDAEAYRWWDESHKDESGAAHEPFAKNYWSRQVRADDHVLAPRDFATQEDNASEASQSAPAETSQSEAKAKVAMRRATRLAESATVPAETSPSPVISAEEHIGDSTKMVPEAPGSEESAEEVEAKPMPKKGKKASEPKAAKPERDPVVVAPYVPPASEPVSVFRGRKVRPAIEWDDSNNVCGIFAGVPNAEYHDGEGISASQLKRFAISPAHYMVTERKESDAFDLGSACHAVICEGRTLHEGGYIVERDGLNRRTTKGKEWIEAHKAAGWTVLTQEQYDKVAWIAIGVHADENAKVVKAAGLAELSVRVNDPATGLTLRARFDRAPAEGEALLDLKTCRDASPEGFGRDADNFGYLLQAAHYLHVARLAGLPYSVFRFIAVATEAPYEVGVYDFGPEHPLWEPVYGELLELYARFKACLYAQQWPKRTWAQAISVPRWSVYRRERTDEIPY